MSMNVVSKVALFALAVGAVTVSSHAMAQAAPQADVPGHPRVNEVNNRLDNQQNRINNGLANGTMTQKQAARDETHDANIARRDSVARPGAGGEPGVSWRQHRAASTMAI